MTTIIISFKLKTFEYDDYISLGVKKNEADKLLAELQDSPHLGVRLIADYVGESQAYVDRNIVFFNAVKSAKPDYVVELRKGVWYVNGLRKPKGIK